VSFCSFSLPGRRQRVGKSVFSTAGRKRREGGLSDAGVAEWWLRPVISAARVGEQLCESD
jgi:hypothetical protein